MGALAAPRSSFDIFREAIVSFFRLRNFLKVEKILNFAQKAPSEQNFGGRGGKSKRFFFATQNDPPRPTSILFRKEGTEN